MPTKRALTHMNLTGPALMVVLKSRIVMIEAPNSFFWAVLLFSIFWYFFVKLSEVTFWVRVSLFGLFLSRINLK